jgi:hypothetical protein
MAVSKTKPTISAPIIQYKPKTQPPRERPEAKRKAAKASGDMLLDNAETKREKRVFSMLLCHLFPFLDSLLPFVNIFVISISDILLCSEIYYYYFFAYLNRRH